MKIKGEYKDLLGHGKSSFMKCVRVGLCIENAFC